MECCIKVIEAYLVELLVVVHSRHIITEGHVWRNQPAAVLLDNLNDGSAAGVTLGSTSFGNITSATGGRVLQLGAKLAF
jgi:hypothetical protein